MGNRMGLRVGPGVGLQAMTAIYLRDPGGTGREERLRITAIIIFFPMDGPDGAITVVRHPSAEDPDLDLFILTGGRRHGLRRKPVQFTSGGAYNEQTMDSSLKRALDRASGLGRNRFFRGIRCSRSRSAPGKVFGLSTAAAHQSRLAARMGKGALLYWARRRRD